MPKEGLRISWARMHALLAQAIPPAPADRSPKNAAPPRRRRPTSQRRKISRCLAAKSCNALCSSARNQPSGSRSGFQTRTTHDSDPSPARSLLRYRRKCKAPFPGRVNHWVNHCRTKVTLEAPHPALPSSANREGRGRGPRGRPVFQLLQLREEGARASFDGLTR